MPLKKLLGNKVADICQTGKGNKAIPSVLGLQPLSTNKTMLNLAWSGRPSQVTPRAD